MNFMTFYCLGQKLLLFQFLKLLVIIRMKKFVKQIIYIDLRKKLKFLIFIHWKCYKKIWFLSGTNHLLKVVEQSKTKLFSGSPVTSSTMKNSTTSKNLYFLITDSKRSWQNCWYIKIIILKNFKEQFELVSCVFSFCSKRFKFV